MNLDETTLEPVAPPNSSLAELAEEIRREFQSSPYQELRRAHCRMEEGRLVLRGEVSTYHLKQLAQSLLQRRIGRRAAVENLLQVTPRLDARAATVQGIS